MSFHTNGDIINILAVCTGNICRSPMAEGILRKIFENNPLVRVSSAGTHAIHGNAAADFAVIASSENGIDISCHRAQTLNSGLVRISEVILCMERAHFEAALSIDTSAFSRVFNLADFSGSKKLKSIPDPYGCSLREYRSCFQEIALCIGNFIAAQKIIRPLL